MDLIPFVEHALVELNHNKSAELGDRTQYIGSSDVGSCPRKVCLQKTCPGGEPDVSTMLRFTRGHVAETLLADICNAAGVRNLYDTQVEVRHPVYPLKAHIDFLFYANFDGKPQLHIVELKSVSGIPDEPYPQWVDQINFQLGLLRLKYPKGKLGGSILAIDLNAGELKQFSGFEYNEALFTYLVSKGVRMLDCLNGLEEPQSTPSFLCTYCSYRSDCPAMTMPEVELPPEIETLAHRYLKLHEVRHAADTKLKNIREGLLEFTGPSFRGRSDTIELIVSSVGPTAMVDSKLLKLQYPDVYPVVLKERSGFTKLECRPTA